MITDIIDLLDISIAQTDQTLSSIIKPNTQNPQYLITILSTTLILYGQQSQLTHIKAHLNKDDL